LCPNKRINPTASFYVGSSNVLGLIVLKNIVLQSCHSKKVLWQKMLARKIKHFLLLIIRVVILSVIVAMGGGLCATPLGHCKYSKYKSLQKIFQMKKCLYF